MKSRWKCPECGSHNIQVVVRAWFKESSDFELHFLEVDQEAEISEWLCTDCEVSDTGKPNEVAA